MLEIRQFTAADEESVVNLSLKAWAPVFSSFRAVLGDVVYDAIYPDWASQQADAVRETLADEPIISWVAVREGTVAGFVSAGVHPSPLPDGRRFGEILMLAVDPVHQRRGVGKALTDAALDWMREQKLAFAGVETGGDPGHVPARATYEKAGFTQLPISRYFQAL